MILYAIMIALSAQINDAKPTTPDALVDAFRLCLRDETPLVDIDQAATGAGFERVAPDTATDETHAWKKDGVQLYALAAQNNQRWRLGAMCGVSADLGRFDKEDIMLQPLSKTSKIWFTESVGRAHWNVVSDAGVIEMFVDRTKPDHVRVDIVIDPLSRPTAK